MSGALLLTLLLTQTSDCDAVAGARSLGLATAGSEGLVALELEGAPVLGHPFALRVSGARPGTFGFLVTAPGVEPTPLPVFGATLFPGGPWSLVPFRVGPDGGSPALAVRARVVPELLGHAFTAQAVVVDERAQGGLAFTKAARFCFGDEAAGPAFPVPSLDTIERIDHLWTDDANGDGIVDVIASAPGPAGNPHVFLGRGDGVFAPAVVSSIGYASFDVLAVGHLDGDGRLDAIGQGFEVPSLLSTIEALRGDGTGRFTSIQAQALSGFPEQVALGDLDADGDQDVVMTRTRHSGGVAVFLGRGDGTLEPPVWLSIDFTPFGDLALADLDLDGDLDLVVRSSDAEVALGNGDGTFGPFVTYPVPFVNVMGDFELADVDLDGRLDLVVGRERDNAYVIMYGAPGGAFPSGVLGSIRKNGFNTPKELIVAEVTGDGRLDLIVPRALDLVVQHGDERGRFQGAATILPTNVPDDTHVADIDGDGRPDLLQGYFRRVAILANQGRGSFLGPDRHDIGNGNRSPVLVDLNGDQRLDVALAAFTDSELVVVPGREGTALGPPSHLATPFGPVALVAADLDDDGVPDLAAACQPADQMAVFLGDGAGGFTPLPPFGGVVGPTDLAAGDVDADGTLDLVVANGDGNTVSVFPGPSATARSGPPPSSAPGRSPPRSCSRTSTGTATSTSPPARVATA
jgi:hypothetical protein